MPIITNKEVNINRPDIINENSANLCTLVDTTVASKRNGTWYSTMHLDPLKSNFFTADVLA